jgi:hypothetical protein
VSVGRCRIGVVVSVYDRRLPACFCFLVRAMCMSLDKVSYDGVASHWVGHMDSLNVILTKYSRAFPDTKLRLGLFVKVSQRGSPGVKDAITDATCQLEAIV